MLIGHETVILGQADAGGRRHSQETYVLHY
jgi:hypothetical protein